MINFNMRLLSKTKGSNITIYLRNPKEGLDLLTFFPYWLEKYENMIIIEQISDEFINRTWIPLSEIFRIEESFDKKNEPYPIQN